MLEVLSLDTLPEWEKAITAIAIFVLSFSLVSKIAAQVFKALGAISFLAIAYWIVREIGHEHFTGWKEIIEISLGLGMLLAFVLAPFIVIADFDKRIDNTKD